MLRELKPDETIRTGQFGGFCPHWTVLDGRVLVADTAEQILDALPDERRVIDPVGVLELLQFNHMLGERTLVQCVRRMPWRATLHGNGTIERRPPLRHGGRNVKPSDAAGELRRRLDTELFEMTRSRRHVYMLLTGGLDSRVVAGILKSLEPRLNGRIIAVTWGHPASRDVAYARRIAHWYDWAHEHIPYDAVLTWTNVQRGAVWGGSEVAGIHLHGLDWFRRVERDDLVLASSYGDSIGRAEYSGVHLANLCLQPIRNTAGILHPALAAHLFEDVRRDRAAAWQGAEDRETARLELDMQENYMRRMIGHAMDYVRQFCDLEQAFTSDDVVGYMWSLAPQVRTDDVYGELLRDLDARLHGLPWARTGIAPDGGIESDGSLRAQYHEWRTWIGGELRQHLDPLQRSDGLRQLGLFWGPALRIDWGGETAVKLASIELARRRFNLRPCRDSTHWQDLATDAARRGSRKLVRVGLNAGRRCAAALRGAA